MSVPSTGLSKHEKLGIGHEKPGIGHNRPPHGAPDWLTLKRKISVKEAAELNSMSEDTFRRRYKHLIKKVSPRRDAVELGDALNIGEPKI